MSADKTVNGIQIFKILTQKVDVSYSSNLPGRLSYGEAFRGIGVHTKRGLFLLLRRNAYFLIRNIPIIIYY